MRSQACRRFEKNDITNLLDKIFAKYDLNNDGSISKFEFPKVLRNIVDLVGGNIPTQDEVMDLFYVLDVNGDQNIDRFQMKLLLIKFFQILNNAGIQVLVGKQTDQLY